MHADARAAAGITVYCRIAPFARVTWHVYQNGTLKAAFLSQQEAETFADELARGLIEQGETA